MSFIRPEIRDAALRWRESLAGFCATALGVYLGLTGTLAAQIIAGGLVLGGGLLIVAGYQRGRFRRSGAGAGVVSLDEGRLSYFGPQTGGVIAVSELASVDLIHGRDGSSWSLGDAAGASVLIPTNAAGAEILFDVFGALQGLTTPEVLRALDAAKPGRTLIWARPAAQPRVSAH